MRSTRAKAAARLACVAGALVVASAAPGCSPSAAALPEAAGQSDPGAGALSSGLPVFPGAEGFGTRTRAGRGGIVVAVTSLADRGAGTLRAALQDPSPKIIVFRVGGVIELESHLFIDHPFVTIAGQTAPGDGIVLKDFGIVITTNDVLVQSIRIRPGDRGAVRPDHNDAIAILGPNGNARGAYNVVIDHVSASWTEDETISTWFGPHDITVSWSIISEALNRSRHPKETHSAGLIVGDHSDRVSLHHNLFAHNDFRNPLIATGGTHDVVNNVVYNWGTLATEIVDDANMVVNVVGNYYRPGPSTRTPSEILISPSDKRAATRLFLSGNARSDRSTVPGNDWNRVQYGWNGATVPARFRAAARAATAPITTDTPTEALRLVLQGAGAIAPRRDAVDARVVADTANGTGRIIDSPSQLGGFPRYAGGAAPADLDGDGMPDEWERQQGLNPSNRADALTDLDADGYTNVEEYLHALMPAPRPPVSK